MTRIKLFNSPSFWFVPVTLFVYANSFLGGFQFDDFEAILANPHLDRWHTFVGHLDHMVRPALYFTFFLDRMFFVESAWGYHFTNVGLHLLSGYLVYGIILRAGVEKREWIAFWTALLFLVHPLSTETVTYLSGRASGLMTCLYLVAFLLFLQATADSEGQRTRQARYAGAFLAFLLAVGSKETAVTFPLAILLWDVLIRRQPWPVFRHRFLTYHMPFWVLAVVGTLVVLWKHPQYAYLADFSLHLRPIRENILSQVHAVAYSILLFFAPWKQNFDHDLPIVHSLFQWTLILDVIVLSGFIAAAVLSFRRFPLAAFGIGWFFLQLLPTNSVIPRNDLLSERNVYLASIGLFMAVIVFGMGVSRWIGEERLTIFRLRTIVRTAGLAWVMALCVLTVQRNALYQDPVRLWSDTVHKSPHKARPHNNLGHAYALRGDWERAIEEFRAALTLNPDYPLAQENLRNAYLFHVGRSD